MVDPQEPPDMRPEAAPGVPAQPPAPDAAAKPAKAVPKPPAKKVPAKKAPVPAAKKAPAKKAPAAKKAPVKKAVTPAAPLPVVPAPGVPAAALNGAGPVLEGAREVAAQAKSTVEEATDSVVAPLLQPVRRTRAPLPIAVAVLVSLLAVVVVRQLRRSSDNA